MVFSKAGGGPKKEGCRHGELCGKNGGFVRLPVMGVFRTAWGGPKKAGSRQVELCGQDGGVRQTSRDEGFEDSMVGHKESRLSEGGVMWPGWGVH